MITYWIHLDQSELTFQIYNDGYKTIIISQKKNLNKLWGLILN
jgi:hypothetical protein